ncbi:MAG: hypothetical protein KDA79_18180, partial [Planctomycetaceae bacterium]|nr:hypothetical protein [Planctomycetaceae bacterium]
IMAGLNGRRLQSAGSLWGPVLIGVGLAVLDILVEIFLFESYLFSLMLYLGALWLLWAMYLQPQIALYDRQPTCGGQIGRWIVPAISGAPAALLVLLAFVLYPLLPPEPVEVCRKLVAADSLEEAKECCTASLWPALTALDSLEGDAGVENSFVLTGEEEASGELSGYLVAWRGSWREGDGSHPMESIFHLVEVDGHWKVQEWYCTAYDGQQAEQPVPLSMAYREIVAAARQQHYSPGSPLKSGSDSTPGDFKWSGFSGVADTVQQNQVWFRGILRGTWLLSETGTFRKFGVLLLACGAGIAGIGRWLASEEKK